VSLCLFVHCFWPVNQAQSCRRLMCPPAANYSYFAPIRNAGGSAISVSTVAVQRRLYNFTGIGLIRCLAPWISVASAVGKGQWVTWTATTYVYVWSEISYRISSDHALAHVFGPVGASGSFRVVRNHELSHQRGGTGFRSALAWTGTCGNRFSDDRGPFQVRLLLTHLPEVTM